jgi:AraC-like DNA-binding protein
MRPDIRQRLTDTTLRRRESETPHYSYDEEMLPFDLFRNGDPRASEQMTAIFLSGGEGKLSDDPLRNAQYHFACAMTLTTRAAIQGGMEPGAAYNASDAYIQTADKCQSVAEVQAVHHDMVRYFVQQMSNLRRQNVYSKPVVRCLDYIYDHIQQSIAVRELAAFVGVNASYLSTLFKREVGLSLSEYIRRKRVETAEALLRYSDYSLTEISQYLAFSSYSHFAEVFARHTGQTPRQYRRGVYRKGLAPG